MRKEIGLENLDEPNYVFVFYDLHSVLSYHAKYTKHYKKEGIYKSSRILIGASSFKIEFWFKE